MEYITINTHVRNEFEYPYFVNGGVIYITNLPFTPGDDVKFELNSDGNIQLLNATTGMHLAIDSVQTTTNVEQLGWELIYDSAPLGHDTTAAVATKYGIIKLGEYYGAFKLYKKNNVFRQLTQTGNCFPPDHVIDMILTDDVPFCIPVGLCFWTVMLNNFVSCWMETFTGILTFCDANAAVKTINIESLHSGILSAVTIDGNTSIYCCIHSNGEYMLFNTADRTSDKFCIKTVDKIPSMRSIFDSTLNVRVFGEMYCGPDHWMIKPTYGNEVGCPSGRCELPGGFVLSFYEVDFFTVARYTVYYIGDVYFAKSEMYPRSYNRMAATPSAGRSVKCALSME